MKGQLQSVLTDPLSSITPSPPPLPSPTNTHTRTWAWTLPRRGLPPAAPGAAGCSCRKRMPRRRRRGRARRGGRSEGSL
jgi:hypothetical protein